MKRKTGVPKVNRARRAKEFARAYHSEERVNFVRGLPCVVCGRTPCDNAHIETGGTGRKADYDKIVPLCTHNPLGEHFGHHRVLHNMGRESFEEGYGLDLDESAEDTEARWQQFSGRVPMENET